MKQKVFGVDWSVFCLTISLLAARTLFQSQLPSSPIVEEDKEEEEAEAAAEEAESEAEEADALAGCLFFRLRLFVPKAVAEDGAASSRSLFGTADIAESESLGHFRGPGGENNFFYFESRKLTVTDVSAGEYLGPVRAPAAAADSCDRVAAVFTHLLFPPPRM